MKKLMKTLVDTYPGGNLLHLSLLLFRVALSLELMIAHGLKKLGIGVPQAEQVPNPLHLPETFNTLFAGAANLFFPLLVIFGLLTRVAVLPILTVTLSGYFIMHWNDPLLVRDIPFMYSLSYLLVLALGPGKYSVDHLIHKRWVRDQK